VDLRIELVQILSPDHPCPRAFEFLPGGQQIRIAPQRDRNGLLDGQWLGRSEAWLDSLNSQDCRDSDQR
jgi:hypothetical protein